MAISVNKTYRIISHAGLGRRLCVKDIGRIINHDNVKLSSVDNTLFSQKWLFKRISGQYKLLSPQNENYSLNYYWTSGDGNPGNCDLFPYSGNDDDSTLSFSKVSTNVYKIMLARNNLCLSAVNNAAGANVRWEADNGSSAQHWKFEECTSTALYWPTSCKTLSQDYSSDHPALDIQPTTHGVEGDPIYAIADGVIERKFVQNNNSSSLSGNDTMGNCLFIAHSPSESNTPYYLRSMYMHMMSFAANTTVGSNVTKGQLLGYMGHTGYTLPIGVYGTHLHLGLKYNTTAFNDGNFNTGNFANPAEYEFTDTITF